MVAARQEWEVLEGIVHLRTTLSTPKACLVLSQKAGSAQPHLPVHPLSSDRGSVMRRVARQGAVLCLQVCPALAVVV